MEVEKTVSRAGTQKMAGSTVCFRFLWFAACRVASITTSPLRKKRYFVSSRHDLISGRNGINNYNMACCCSGN